MRSVALLIAAVLLAYLAAANGGNVMNMLYKYLMSLLTCSLLQAGITECESYSLQIRETEIQL